MLEVEGQKKATLHAGEAFHEPAGVVHLSTANASSTQPVRFLALVLGPKDKPSVLPVNGG